jgi:uncharacterized protein YutE (UPF0331/DUF86 family)
MVDDVVVNKVGMIERCLARVREEYGEDGAGIDLDQRRQDALVLNLLRACETAIDVAMHVVRVRALGVPESSRHAFVLLVEAGLLDRELGGDLQRKVGFRNIAVHRYQELDLGVVHAVVRDKLGRFEAFAAAMLRIGALPALHGRRRLNARSRTPRPAPPVPRRRRGASGRPRRARRGRSRPRPLRWHRWG